MPEVYKKFRESQGLASISQALKASQAAKEANPPEKEQTSTAEGRKGTKGLKSGLRGVGELGTDVELPSSAAIEKKKGKTRGNEGGQLDGDAEGSGGRSGPPGRKRSKTQSTASAAVRNAESTPPGLAHRQAGTGVTDNEMHEEHEAKQEPPAQTFRDFYVKTFSSAFATELFNLRQADGEKLSLDLLLRHLESGINIFSDTERKLLQQGQPTSQPS